MSQTPKSRKILVTGASGLLGSHVLAVLSAKNDVVGWSHSADRAPLHRLDATNARQVDQFFRTHKPEICVHCIASPDVLACERDPDMADRLNAQTTEHVARACTESGAKLVYISTEYVFDGTAVDGYTEDSQPRPLQTYGRTKLRGEEHAAQVPHHLTVRLPVLYGGPVQDRKPTWIESLLRSLEQGVPVELDDHFERQPTWSYDVATVLARAIDQDLEGILHVATQEGLTKFAWGVKLAEAAGLPSSLVRPSTAPPESSGPRKPARPWLHTHRLQQLGIPSPPGVSERVAAYLRSLGRERKVQTS
ncbi:SDR family oxidoreductase [Archangium violaceum]|uniref:SDR family oxidoreductase n=1 Tax=Archangium violaceum TaxID=83451 RepID=UPI002B3122CA|nr:SDR family oxidoreductase [Archangium violaceum]